MSRSQEALAAPQAVELGPRSSRSRRVPINNSRSRLMPARFAARGRSRFSAACVQRAVRLQMPSPWRGVARHRHAVRRSVADHIFESRGSRSMRPFRTPKSLNPDGAMVTPSAPLCDEPLMVTGRPGVECRRRCSPRADDFEQRHRRDVRTHQTPRPITAFEIDRLCHASSFERRSLQGNR